MMGDRYRSVVRRPRLACNDRCPRPMAYVRSFRDLAVYRKADEIADQIHHSSASFPPEERYSLTDQIRRSSRSVGAHIAEAWGKRRYQRSFIVRLTDADAEQLETQHWIRTAAKCGYLKEEEARRLRAGLSEVGKMLNSMMRNADRFCGRITDN